MQHIPQINENILCIPKDDAGYEIHRLWSDHFKLSFDFYKIQCLFCSIFCTWNNFVSIDKKRLGQRLSFDPEGSKMTIRHLGEQKKVCPKKRI